MRVALTVRTSVVVGVRISLGRGHDEGSRDRQNNRWSAGLGAFPYRKLLLGPH